MTDSWITSPVLGFDIETTGVRVTQDRIVTAALVYRPTLTSSDQQVQTWLANPGITIPEQASAIHGITTEYAQTHGEEPAEIVDAIADRLCRHWAAGLPVVGFNVAFDLELLSFELDRHQLPSLGARLKREPKPVIDPLVLDRALDRFRRGKRTLQLLCDHYRVPVSSELHDAEVDVTATLDVLAAQLQSFPKLAQFTLPQLHNWQSQKHHEWAQNLTAFLQSRDSSRSGPRLTWLDINWS